MQVKLALPQMVALIITRYFPPISDATKGATVHQGFRAFELHKNHFAPVSDIFIITIDISFEKVDRQDRTELLTVVLVVIIIIDVGRHCFRALLRIP